MKEVTVIYTMEITEIYKDEAAEAMSDTKFAAAVAPKIAKSIKGLLGSDDVVIDKIQVFPTGEAHES